MLDVRHHQGLRLALGAFRTSPVTNLYVEADELSLYLRWLVVGCFGLNGPLRQYFSLYRAVFQREGERNEK